MTGSNNYLVRAEFADCAVWRDALGNAEPLLAFASTGDCLDAPEHVPAGAMRANKYGPMAQYASRIY